MRIAQPPATSRQPPATMIEKVVAFVTRAERELLLFQHPTAGIQLPAGTVEAGEGLETAVLRETAEETGLTAVTIQRCLGWADDPRPPDGMWVDRDTAVYAKPDPASHHWAALPRRQYVTRLAAENGFIQVSYVDNDELRDHRYAPCQITGWVPQDALTRTRRRHFYHLTFSGHTPERWQVQTDGHTFTLFWASLNALPSLISPQDTWLAHFR
ncbi:MAG TPA: NUDIX domain-containing protein [Chloroflexi bacterium]|nr:NUDIX domain-containing protein [Chloroflexota bacterium]